MKLLSLIAILLASTVASADDPSNELPASILGVLDGQILKTEGEICVAQVIYDSPPSDRIRFYWQNSLDPEVPYNQDCDRMVELRRSGDSYAGNDEKTTQEIKLVKADEQSLKFLIGSSEKVFTKHDWQLCETDKKGKLCRIDTVLLPNDSESFYHITRIHLPTQSVYLIAEGYNEVANPEMVIKSDMSTVVRRTKACSNEICAASLVEYLDAANVPEALKGVDLTWLEVHDAFEDGRVTLVVIDGDKMIEVVAKSSDLKVKPQ